MENKKVSLKKFIWLSIFAAVITILLKFYAWYLTGSAGLMSDAVESLVNLVAAIMALKLLSIAMKPADEKHLFGHSKAEYFSSAIEGVMIILAAGSIIWASIPRFINPVEIENTGIGLVFSAIASAVNLVVALILIRNGKKHKSILLEADGKHLMTDVWTSLGVILAVIVVEFTGWLILDPIIAVLVAINIIVSGVVLIKRSANGLLDAAIDSEGLKKIENLLDSYKKDKKIIFHSLLTRQAGQRIFISMHILVPGEWTVKQGHDVSEQIEKDLFDLFDQPINVITHIEPIEDPKSFNDIDLDRKFD
ncbi:MAG: cation transporter [Bacteroidales bacterium]|jgi:cation diffusion facilitator family transporter|nr:cation transporter [Bacteroidales bacterium]